MIIAFDLDGIVCTPIRNKVDLEGAETCRVLSEAKEAITQLKSLGHSIMIFSSRELSLGLVTQEWLQHNKIPYDYIILNKPDYDILIDSKVYKFDSWKNFLKIYKYRLESK